MTSMKGTLLACLTLSIVCVSRSRPLILGPGSIYQKARLPLFGSCHGSCHSLSTSRARAPLFHASYDYAHTLDHVFQLRAGDIIDGPDEEDLFALQGLVADARDWCVNLRSPSALIAGAVVATLYENVRGRQLELQSYDTRYAKFAKRITISLLMSAFALEIVAIFVTTVSSTMFQSMDIKAFYASKLMASSRPLSHSGLAFFHEYFEFEYLTSWVAFLQGLLHWLAAVAFEYSIPKAGEGGEAPKMDQFVAVSMSTLMLLLLSFYNKRLVFFDNYFQMIVRWLKVSAQQFLYPCPMAFLYVPGVLFSIYLGILAFSEEVYVSKSAALEEVRESFKIAK